MYKIKKVNLNKLGKNLKFMSAFIENKKFDVLYLQETSSYEQDSKKLKNSSKQNIFDEFYYSLVEVDGIRLPVSILFEILCGKKLKDCTVNEQATFLKAIKKDSKKIEKRMWK